MEEVKIKKINGERMTKDVLWEIFVRKNPTSNIDLIVLTLNMSQNATIRPHK